MHQELLPDASHSDSQSSVEVRWRTLLADQRPLGQKLGQKEFKGHPIPSSEAEEATLLDDPDLLDEMPSLEGRAVIITSAGHLGLAPKETQPADEISVMAGGALPYILRPSYTEDEYTLIGEW